MKPVITGDGSKTFFNEEYQETYHSKTGAVEEAVKKFVEPVKDKVRPRILDICFGLGYNSAAALGVFEECYIIGIENDAKVIREIQDAPFRHYNEIQLATQGKSSRVEIRVADARKDIKKLDAESFDIVFLDPFSPKKCPELWSEAFFRDIFRIMKPGGILTTYSCARTVRENLRNAGFQVRDGPKVGRRGPSTIAPKPL